MMPSSEALNLYTHNTKDAFNEGDERAEAQFMRLAGLVAEDRLDAGFLSEACSVDHASQEHLQSVLDRFGALGLKAFAFEYSEPDRPDRHIGVMFMRRELYAGQQQVLDVAGRGVLEVAVRTPSGKTFAMLGAHLNDRHDPRVEETAALRRHVARRSADGVPVIAMGDANSDAVNAERNLAAWVFHAGGQVMSHIKPAVRQAAEQEAGRRRTWYGRIASLAIRSYYQLEGDTIRQLLDGERPLLASANPEHLPTGHIPKNVPGRGILRRLSWLDRPYIEADYIMADQGRFADFKRYDRLPGDEHRAVSAVLHLGQLAVAA